MKTFILLIGAALVAFCIDQADIFSTDSGPVKTTPIYNASLMVEGSGKVIHVDPSGQANYKGLPKADLILITSSSPEHLDPMQIAKLSKKTTAIVAPAGPATKLQHCTALSNGESVSFGDIAIEAIPAYRVAASGSDTRRAQEKGQQNGYVLTFPGLRMYISGDTSFIPEMKKLRNMDVVFLSVGAPETMSLGEGADAIRAIKPKVVYPNHYKQTAADEVKNQLAVPGTEIRMRHWY